MHVQEQSQTPKLMYLGGSESSKKATPHLPVAVQRTNILPGDAKQNNSPKQIDLMQPDNAIKVSSVSTKLDTKQNSQSPLVRQALHNQEDVYQGPSILN